MILNEKNRRDSLFLVVFFVFVSIFFFWGRECIYADVQMDNIQSGTMGDNDGFEWTYDATTKTMTVTGEGRGLEGDVYSNKFKIISNQYRFEVESIVFENCIFIDNLSYMFNNFSSLKNIQFINCDTSNVTNMLGMFYGCSELRNLDLNGFNTSNVEDMSYMFLLCSRLTKLDISSFNTSNVTKMNSMFYGCSGLTSLDIGGFDVSNVKDMSYMFWLCSELTNVDIAGFDTSNVMNMQYMFGSCKKLKNLDLSSFETSHVSNMQYMFYGCTELTSLNLSNFDISNVINTNYMFYDCNNIQIMHTPAKANMDILIDLPGFFSDKNGNIIVELTKEYCNRVLERISSFNITYKLNGGINHSNNPTFYKVSDESITLKNPSYMGYKFEGWYTDAEYKTKVTEIAKGSIGHITLYAKWLPNSYTITYELNGGTNCRNNPTSYDVTSAITLQNPTRTGYTFAGWYSDKNLSNKVTTIAKGSTGNKTFYAKWIPNNYSINFDGNGATSGKMSVMSSKQYDTSFQLFSNAYKRKGYTFTGWNTQKDGKGISYTDKASVKNLTSENGKTITLYAQWKKIKYKITYKLNGGKNNKKNKSSYYVTTSTFKLKNPTRKGYTFKGWYSDKKCTKKVTKITKGTTGNKTYYAKWTKTKYKITYNLNKGKNNKSNKKTYYVTTKTFKLKNPTRKGYVFKGWYSDKKCTKKVTKIKKGSTGNIKLYAKWVKKK